MLTRSNLKLGEGELVETNLEIGRVYSQRRMVKGVPLESESQFMDNFMAMQAMVEEMYGEFKKDRGESTSTPEQGKGVEEPLLVAHSEGKRKGEEPPPSTPPSSPEKKKKKTSLIKLDVMFHLPIHDG